MSRQLSAEDYCFARDDLPDGGRWTELHAGEIVHLNAPDSEHGNAVLNLTKAIADCAQPGSSGYACFELGLIVQRNPDTVWSPAISFYVRGPAFAEADKIVSDVPPALVVEVPSSNDRRLGLEDRIRRWLEWGVEAVWVLDPHQAAVHVLAPPRSPRHLTEDDVLDGGGIIPRLQVAVRRIFQPPSWWK